jgi:nickel/cobalt exporter
MSEFYGNFLKQITMYQHELNRLISSNLRDVGSQESFVAIFSILGIAFIYGAIHAAGPGHGKALVALYFLREKSSYKKAFQMGYMIAITHALSALSITLIIYYLIQGMFSRTFKNASDYSMIFSSSLIIIVGFYLLYEAYKERNMKEDENVKLSNKSAIATAISAGIVPCPGVMTITLFAITLGHLSVGIAAAVVMSIGMGLTISLAAIATISLKTRTSFVFGKHLYILQYFGALMVIFLGSILLLANF